MNQAGVGVLGLGYPAIQAWLVLLWPLHQLVGEEQADDFLAVGVGEEEGILGGS